MPRPLTDRALREIRDGKRPMPSFHHTARAWIELLLEERRARRRQLRARARR